MFSVRNTTYTVHTPTAFRHSIHCCQKDYSAFKLRLCTGVSIPAVCHLPMSNRNGCYKPTQYIGLTSITKIG
jgi:hypothetical protein